MSFFNIILIFITLLSVPIIENTNFKQVDPIKLKYNQADFVGMVYFKNTNKQSQKYFILGVTESYKGLVKHLKIHRSQMTFDNTQTYLLYAELEGSLIKNIQSLNSINHIPEEISAFIDKLPCYKKREDHLEFVRDCLKINDPICGCNGVTYNNVCEMKKAGIIKFKPGKCSS